MKKNSRSSLPEELKGLISETISLWGESLKQSHGKVFYNQIETLRKKCKQIAQKKSSAQAVDLSTLLTTFQSKKTEELHQIALAFSLMLELINRCETAYRTHRLKSKPIDQKDSDAKSPYALIYVFTAHPTEARSEEVLTLFKIIEKCLQKALSGSFSDIKDELSGYLKLALKITIVKLNKPTVEDEAISIYRYSLSEEILNLQCQLKENGLTLHFRSWVGGDKDGHPGVDEKTMIMSLGHSREKIIIYASRLLNSTTELLRLLPNQESKPLLKEVENIHQSIIKLTSIKNGDGKSITALKSKIATLGPKIAKSIGQQLAPFKRLETLLWIYPALVLPLEIREDSEIVMQTGQDKGLAIVRMITTLKNIAGDMDPRWYVRGFVLSMCEEAIHLEAAYKLLHQIFGSHPIPVIPLFENQKALSRGSEILGTFFKRNKSVIKEHKEKREGRYEIMLGYSDSSKENGVLASRVLIYETLAELDSFLKSFKLTPVFFHGSGGSVERGGGSIKEQIAWWPESALNIYKATVQGEMVARTLANDTILGGQVDKILSEFARRKNPTKVKSIHPHLLKFSEQASHYYKELVATDDFWELIEACTPYDYLDLLKIGSRPSKRGAQKARRKLRAIPWVLCWTQIRLLLPTWWGVGLAWSELTSKEQLSLIKLYRNDPFLQSFAKSFGFTLKKIELGIFESYLNASSLDSKAAAAWKKRIRSELELAAKFLSDLTGESELIWERPWLSESIDLRSPNITPLNLIQIVALQRHEENLLRETVTGIATGMLTTG